MAGQSAVPLPPVPLSPLTAMVQADEEPRADHLSPVFIAVDAALASRSEKPVARAVVPGALRAAFDLAARPSLARLMRKQPLPPSVPIVVRIAAGCPDELGRSVAASGKDPALVRAAAIIYVQQVLWAPENDHYRALGVAPDAEPIEFAVHLLWFAKWVAAEGGWRGLDGVFASKVLPAWNSLKTPELRRNYDQLRHGGAEAARARPGVTKSGERRIPWTGRGEGRGGATSQWGASARPGRIKRWQIAAVVAGIVALAALAAVDWMVFMSPADKVAEKSGFVSTSSRPASVEAAAKPHGL